MGKPQPANAARKTTRRSGSGSSCKKVSSPTRQRRPSAPKSRFNPIVKWLCVGFIGLFAVLFLILFSLRWMPVPTSAFMLRAKLDGKSTEYRWVDGDHISSNIAIAVIAAEDQRFPHHKGFDFDAIMDAIEDNRRRSTPRGASTISQQVAKNLFLWSGRSLLRKGLEAGLTVAIEVCWPKERILEIYLNIAQFGPDTFGVAAASRRFFHKKPARLTLYEASLLAAVLPSPENYALAPPSPYVRERAADIREQVRLLGGPSYLAGIYR